MSILLYLACTSGSGDATPTDDSAEPCQEQPWYADADGDGWPAQEGAVEACEAPEGHIAEGEGWDCDDADAAIHPEAGEFCNEVDDDCDGDVDEEDTDLSSEELTTWYADGDQDGYGNPDSTVVRCHQPSGYVATGDDCDDDEAGANPGATEICEDGIDNDCDGSAGDCSWADEIEGPDLTLSGDGADGFGAAMALASGVLVVGAPERDEVGGVYVFPSSSSGELSTEDADLEILGAAKGDDAGSALAALPDIDGDFAPELLVGVPGSDGGGSEAGAVYLAKLNFIGHQTTSDLGAGWYGLGGQARLGSSVAALGDLDGDGNEDMVMGAPGYGTGSDRRGAVYLAHGPLTGFQGVEGTTARFRGPQEGGAAGTSVSRAGDLDGDGLRELVVGAPNVDGTNTKAGAAYVVLGPATTSVDLEDAGYALHGPTNAALAGQAVLGMGDMNEDGYGEVLVGAPGVDVDGMLDAGEVYLVYGPISSDATLGEGGVIVQGSEEAMALGEVLSAPTVGSGVFLGSPGNSVAWLHMGPMSGTTSVADLDHRVSGGAGEETGCALSAGSVDTDFYLDLVVGSCEASRVEVFLGTGL